MTLAERLKMARESLGYTQKDMATALNTNPQTWQVYESGKSVPGGKVLETLARMGINVNWVLTGEGGMNRGERKGNPENSQETIDKFMEIVRKVYEKGLQTGYTFNPEVMGEFFTHFPSIDELKEDIEECISIGDLKLFVEEYKYTEEIPIKGGAEVVRVRYNDIDVDFLAYIIKTVEDAAKDMRKENIRLSINEKADLISDLYSQHLKPIQKDVVETVKSFHVTRK